jgi:glucose/arabinose dehydrogenase
MIKIRLFFFILVVRTLWSNSSAFSQPLQLENAFPNLTFTQPVFLTHSNDGTNRIFIVQKNGLIKVFPNDPSVTSAKTFLNLSSRIVTGGGGDERGLLGMAFHPNYAGNGYFYVNYTQAGTGRTIVARYSVFSTNPDSANFNSELILLNIYQPFSNHNGGMLFFGQDGYLYIGMGDGGSFGDPGNRAQNLDSLLGKILRIDVDTTIGPQNYGIPPSNPFAGGGGRPEIFAWGMRNPWRISQDSLTSMIWCGDVGQNSWEEVDIIENGRNYGWRIMEGAHCYNPPSGCNQTGLTLPIKEYSHTGGRCSITGGYVYRGSRRPELTGRYIYGDYCSREIWKLMYQGGVITEDAFLITAPAFILSFGTDQFNELHVLCDNGIIYRFNAAPAMITVVVPNGGEDWTIGTSHDIQWSSSNLSGNVKIELSRDGGSSFEVLFPNTTNDGFESWVVTGLPTLNAKIRISSVNNPSVMSTSAGSFTISPAFAFLTKLYVQGGGAAIDGMEIDSLDFGTGAGATDGIDQLFGEYELPPLPPVGVFDVRWQITGTEGTRRDIRDTLGGSRQQVIYTGKLQVGESGYPFHLQWNRLELSDSGSFILKYLADDTLRFVDMKLQDSATINEAETFQVVHNLGTTVLSGVQQGWNIVSVPVTVTDLGRSSVFPTSTPNAFAYTPSGYIARDTLDYGVGYWLKFVSTQLVSVTGEARNLDTIDVVAGWNIIGSISDPVGVGSIVQIPSGIVISPYFGYSSAGYTSVTTIEPMRGYWVKVSQSGQLVFISSLLINSRNKNKME